MNEALITQSITATFASVQPVDAWGDTFFFYNPDRQRAAEIYFATLKSKDDEYDNASNLNRPDVFRLNIGISKATTAPCLARHRRVLIPTRPLRPAMTSAPWINCCRTRFTGACFGSVCLTPARQRSKPCSHCSPRRMIWQSRSMQNAWHASVPARKQHQEVVAQPRDGYNPAIERTSGSI